MQFSACCMCVRIGFVHRWNLHNRTDIGKWQWRCIFYYAFDVRYTLTAYSLNAMGNSWVILFLFRFLISPFCYDTFLLDYAGNARRAVLVGILVYCTHLNELAYTICFALGLFELNYKNCIDHRRTHRHTWVFTITAIESFLFPNGRFKCNANMQLLVVQ